MKRKIATGLLIISVIGFLCYHFNTIADALTTNNIYWYKQNIHLVKDSTLGDNIYSIEKADSISIFSEEYQSVVEEKIQQLSKQTSTPILVYNPYGTNTSSFYYSFKSEQEYSIKYTIQVEDTDINDFTQVAKTNFVDTNTYAYQLIGFVYDKPIH